MKKISAVMVTGIFLVLTSINAFSQTIQTLASGIQPFRLEVGFNKTTNLIFPYAIKSVDRGSKDVLVQKAKDVENILQVKAGKVNFEETNLTVITADGKLYSYVLDYVNSPSSLNIQFAATNDLNPEATFSRGASNEAMIQANAEKVAGKKRTLYAITDKKYGIKLSLNGLFVQNDVMYYQVKIENNSNINYDIDQLRFYIRDQQKSKRTATQELEIKPLYIRNKTKTILGQSEQVLVFALQKFTSPDKKLLTIQLMEKDGGRHLHLSVKNALLMKAALII